MYAIRIRYSFRLSEFPSTVGGGDVMGRFHELDTRVLVVNVVAPMNHGNGYGSDKRAAPRPARVGAPIAVARAERRPMTHPFEAFDTSAHLAALATDGFTVIPDFLNAAQVGKVRQALAPHLGGHSGRNDFEGFDTERVYTLVARGRLFEDLAADPRLLALLDPNLLPGYLLTASQAINIRPGESAQSLHVDDGFYRLPRPRPAVSYSMILAIDDFTAENGATELIPGSRLWDTETATRAAALRGPAPTPMVMKAGACLVFSGILIHRGGANRSPAPRLAITYQYCQPWGRTQENYFLAIPPERVSGMSPRVQALLGYAIWPPFMGHVTASHPLKTLAPGYVPPVALEAWTEVSLWP